ncbi:MAG: hypothetical protein ACI9D4_001582, partial [Polaribacter sp.]
RELLNKKISTALDLTKKPSALAEGFFYVIQSEARESYISIIHFFIFLRDSSFQSEWQDKF